ncbi:MAG: amidohydrolase family protein, partial [Methylovulum sp.]
FADVLNVFKAATSKAGAHLAIDKLGTLTPDAPADVIAVRGNAFERFKLLEYPDLVISGGRVVINRFK